jgi:hypothetical protein
MTRKKAKRNTGNYTSTSSFVSAEDMKDNFFAHTTVRQAQKISGDAGYWTGGRCEWGGSHNLQEDCERLAEFFTSIANISEDIDKIKLSANEETFNSNKQQLISKFQGLIGKCQVSNSYSVASVCCIWNDFFGSFLKPFLDNFTGKLTRQLKEVKKLEPKHQKELLDLESQARAAESAYKENLQNANNETDPNKKAEFIVLANRATRDAERIKQKIKINPLMKVSDFNYLNDLKKLAKGNVPKNVSPDKKGGDTSPRGAKGNDNFLTKYRKEIFMAVVGLGIMFYFYSDNSYEKE